MSDSSRTPATPRLSSADTAATSGGGAASPSAQGKTIIDDSVVAKVAGIAAREVPGVHALGNNAARAFGALRQAVGANDHSQGVRVEVGETQVAADLTLVVEYPVPMQQVADSVRSAVADAVTEIVGMSVVEVNVAIVDVHIPGDDKVADDESRVR
ncbi:Asp23/Gls24 family envelope stress response protein [Rathayibacter toxicus]|uniref:Asp23/Gls24 family envelope stress response protein n=1 Tax=Rathayibacter toxicus TaxID=145458 RepID=A0A0C5BG04_9MICO|nr:Asp23/Gls24 family envelope stress response protein [Rathayibacter toxicus]AJM77125.1 hypothetical protein TI83_02425 [Rathayibacter toxicus]ALS57041.1 hypothetical protein APU90_04050 [Rathayibacter toxicus]KKM46134.1 hypothetical protein VT73_03440 [Rathayibacter toxicus]PPG23085.1 Asp23/Gls24 family envelope stress response protein [Rathayibacter toxicus]PPG47668.1 Asp23/Gls24 family envelope stress response protein [Rathayibacter toxicus]